MTDYTTLKATAEAASKWELCDDPDCTCREDHGAFHTFATPRVVLELLDSIRRADELEAQQSENIVFQAGEIARLLADLDALRTRLAEVEKDADVMHQAITDQENQPSQFGTVTLAMYQRLETKLAYADNVIEQRNAMLHAQWEQKPFAWYDPSADKFTRDLDDPSMNRGAVLWRLFLDAQPSAERPCPTCAHFKQGSKPLVGVYDADCFECKHYYASKWEKKP